MATITIARRQRKTGPRWIVQYVNPKTKKKKYYKTCKTKKEARQVKRELEARLDNGEKVESIKEARNNNATTFNEVADQVEYIWIRKRKEKSIAKATFKGYMAYLAALRNEFGPMPIRFLTKDCILDFRADNVDRHSSSWANRLLFVMKQVTKRAKDEEILLHDPAADIGYLSEKEHERTTAQEPHEIEQLLLKASEGRAKHYLPLAILLGVEHGCSKQEILDLRWEHIDFNVGDTGSITFERTKNGSKRRHQIMPRTREALLARKTHLAKRRKSRKIKVEDSYVVGHLDGTKMGDFKKAWDTVRKKCGFDDLHFHDCRHTFCTNILKAGGTLKAAAALIGHKDPRMTNRYTNLEDWLDNLAQKLHAEHYKKTKKSGEDT